MNAALATVLTLLAGAAGDRTTRFIRGKVVACEAQPSRSVRQNRDGGMDHPSLGLLVKVSVEGERELVVGNSSPLDRRLGKWMPVRPARAEPFLFLDALAPMDGCTSFPAGRPIKLAHLPVPDVCDTGGEICAYRLAREARIDEAELIPRPVNRDGSPRGPALVVNGVWTKDVALAAEIRKQVGERHHRLQYCYEVGLTRDPSLRGSIRFEWPSATVARSTLSSPLVEKCIAAELQRGNGDSDAGSKVAQLELSFDPGVERVPIF